MPITVSRPKPAVTTSMKTVLVLPSEHRHFCFAEQRQKELADECPQDSLFEDSLNADIIDARYLEDWRSRSPLTPPPCNFVSAQVLQPSSSTGNGVDILLS